MQTKSNADLKALRLIVEQSGKITGKPTQFEISNNWIKYLCRIQNTCKDERKELYSSFVMNILQTLVFYKASYAFTTSVWSTNIIIKSQNEEQFFWSLYRICTGIPCKTLGEETLKTKIPYIEMIRMIQIIIQEVGEETFWEQFTEDWTPFTN